MNLQLSFSDVKNVSTPGGRQHRNIGLIHYHQMISNDDLPEIRKWLESTVTKQGFRLKGCIEHNLGSYSALIYHYCFERAGQ